MNFIPLLALSAGVIAGHGDRVTLMVNHNGSPTDVEVIALNKEGDRVPVTAFPAKFRLSKGQHRKVRVSLSDEINALCSTTKVSNISDSGSGSQLELRSCTTRLFKPTQSSPQTDSVQADYLSQLKQALSVPRPAKIVPLSTSGPDTAR